MGRRKGTSEKEDEKESKKKEEKKEESDENFPDLVQPVCRNQTLTKTQTESFCRQQLDKLDQNQACPKRCVSFLQPWLYNQ